MTAFFGVHLVFLTLGTIIGVLGIHALRARSKAIGAVEAERFVAGLPLQGGPALIDFVWLISEAIRTEQILGAADLTLTVEDIAEIDRASASITVEGARYPETMPRLIDR